MSHKNNPLRTFNRLAITLPLLMCFLFALQGGAQGQAGQARTPAEIEWEARQKQAAQKIANTRRQDEIKKDTDKLLELATELKQYVDKTNEQTLSIDVIKKAEEIEKLAHAVKEKMKGS